MEILISEEEAGERMIVAIIMPLSDASGTV
jgi:hypothetical protein